MRRFHGWLVVLVTLVGAGCTSPSPRAPSPRAIASDPSPRAIASDPSPRATQDAPSPRATQDAPSPRATQDAPSPRATQEPPSPRAIPSDPSPLATWDTTPTGNIPLGLPDATVGQGTLDISATCVRLLLENPQAQKTVVLVWPEPTSWNAASQTITFVDPRRGYAPVELRDGDHIMPGGAPAPETPRYKVPPDPSCQADEIFFVNAVLVPKE